MNETDKAEPRKPPVRPTQEAVVQAAIASFLTRGYGATSIDLVARDAGVARRTVYNQFASKEALFEAAVRKVWNDLPQREIALDAPEFANPATALTVLGEAITEFWSPPNAVALLRMAIAENVNFPDLTERFLAARRPPVQELIEYLRRRAYEGSLDIFDPDLAAKQFLGMLNEPLLWWRLTSGRGEPTSTPDEREYIVRQAVTVFLNTYGRTEPAQSPKNRGNRRRTR